MYKTDHQFGGGGLVCFLDEPIVLSDSEEEEVVILEPQEVPRKTR